MPSITKIDESFKHIVYKAGLGPLSSPTRSLLTKTAIHASQALHQGEVFRVHADNLSQRFREITTRKPHNRKRVQSGGRLRVEDAREAIEKRDKERAEKEAQAEQKMLDTIKKRERAALYRAGVTARRYEKLRRQVILDGDIPLGDLGCSIFLEVIPDPEKQWLLDTAQPLRLPSSPPVPSLLSVPRGNNNWLGEDFVSLNQEGDIELVSNIRSSSVNVFHI